MLDLLAQTDVSRDPMINHPAGLLAVLLAVLAVIFWLTQHPVAGRLFKVVPALVFCYFVPTALTTIGVIPDESALYGWIKTFVLPAALLLLILSLDLPAIMRLGPKAIIMLLAGTAGVVIGGPIALLICGPMLPEDVWRGMSALAGSWIGGGANFVAIGEAARVTPTMLSAMVIPDVFIGSIWMGTLLYLSAHQTRIDTFTGADARAIRDLERKMTDFQERVTRVPGLPDLLVILAFGFVGSWFSYSAGVEIDAALEARLTVDALVLSADTDELSTARVTLGADETSDDDLTLMLSIVQPTSDGSITDAVGGEMVRARASSTAEHKLRLASPDVDTLGELVAAINERAGRWHATLADGGDNLAERPSSDLRGCADVAVGVDGASLRMPDTRHLRLWDFHVSVAASTWKFIIVTTLGVLLSFTRARNFEGAGASKIGSVMIYLLVACIGASADFGAIVDAPWLIAMGAVWMCVHIVVLLGVAWLIKAPLFFVAVGSQANIGGAASAPVVAAAFHPSLAPVGALLAVAGYVLGTYAGLMCMQLLKGVAGAG